MTTLYLDVAAVRIQRYLARTQTLRGRRAASNLIALATAPDALDRALAPLRADGVAVGVNTDAGDIDGVVSLHLPDPGEGSRAEVVARIEDVVLAHLRDVLPGATFQSVSGIGETYLAAYSEQIGPAKRSGAVRHDLPVLQELPIAQPCRVCRTDSAREHRLVQDKQTALCPDCIARNIGRQAVVRDRRTPEGRLLADLDGNLDRPTVDDFASLAACGSVERGRNHLGHVAIDGNSYGAFFTALSHWEGHRADGRAQDGRDPRQVKARISATLGQAARTALVSATRSLGLRPGDPLSVVPHVLGGDDLLVSLPAEHVWRFTLALLVAFDEAVRTDDVLDALAAINTARAGTRAQGHDEPDLAMPSASAGVVVAHASQPFTLVVEAGEEQLHDAKRSQYGRVPAVQWLDVTEDGPINPGRDPVPLATLRTADGGPTDTARALDALSTLPASHLAVLLRAVADGGPDLAQVAALRSGHLDEVAPFLNDPEIPLASALSLCRWWT